MNVCRSQFARKIGSSLSVWRRTSATISDRTSGSRARETTFSSLKASDLLALPAIHVLALADVPLLVCDGLPDPSDVLVELQHELAARVGVLRLGGELHQRQQ